MGERESQQAATESRRDLAGQPPTHRHEDALRRFLGAAFYQQAQPAEAKNTDQQPGMTEGESTAEPDEDR